MARRIDQIVIHCSATGPEFDIGVDEIRALHVSHESVLVPWDEGKLAGRGWNDVGYHYVVRRNGDWETGRPEETPGAHVKGWNKHSIGVCLVGGRNGDVNYTKEQWSQLARLVKILEDTHPHATVMGHRDFPGVWKTCPNFDVEVWWYGKGSG